MSTARAERTPETPRERGKRLKLERIEAAARKLFARRGYQETTTRAIADEAGVAAGTLFVYFPEKLDLLMHLYRNGLERVVRESFDALPFELPLDQACARVFEALYDFFAKDPALSRTFVKEMLFLPLEREGKLFHSRMQHYNRLIERVAAAQARGEVRRELPAPSVAFTLFGIYYFALVAWLGGNSGIDAPQRDLLMKASLAQLMQGLEVRS